jgi:hypothetical protein
LPSARGLDDQSIDRYATELAKIIRHGQMPSEVGLTTRADEFFQIVYRELSPDRDREMIGAMGGLQARGAPYVLRLALVAAVCDGVSNIDVHHIEGALSTWRYSLGCAERVFGSSAEVDPHAQQILDYTERHTGQHTKQHYNERVFSKRPPPGLQHILDDLVARGRLGTSRVPVANSNRAVPAYHFVK